MKPFEETSLEAARRLHTSVCWRHGLQPKYGANRVRLRLPTACPPPRGRICLADETAPITQTDLA